MELLSPITLISHPSSVWSCSNCDASVQKPLETPFRRWFQSVLHKLNLMRFATVNAIKESGFSLNGLSIGSRNAPNFFVCKLCCLFSLPFIFICIPPRGGRSAQLPLQITVLLGHCVFCFYQSDYDVSGEPLR